MVEVDFIDNPMCAIQLIDESIIYLHSLLYLFTIDVQQHKLGCMYSVPR